MQILNASQYRNLKYSIDTKNKIDSVNGILRKVYVETVTAYQDGALQVETNTTTKTLDMNGIHFEVTLARIPITIEQSQLIVGKKYKCRCSYTYEQFVSLGGFNETKEGNAEYTAILGPCDFAISPPGDVAVNLFTAAGGGYVVRRFYPNNEAISYISGLLGRYWVEEYDVGQKTYKFDFVVIFKASAKAIGEDKIETSPPGQVQIETRYSYFKNNAAVKDSVVDFSVDVDLVNSDDVSFNLTLGKVVGRTGAESEKVFDIAELNNKERSKLNSPYKLETNEAITITSTVSGEAWQYWMARRIIEKRWRGLYTVSVDIPLASIENRLQLYEQIKFLDIFGKPIKRHGSEVVFEVMKIEYRYEGGGLVQRIEGIEV